MGKKAAKTIIKEVTGGTDVYAEVLKKSHLKKFEAAAILRVDAGRLLALVKKGIQEGKLKQDDFTNWFNKKNGNNKSAPKTEEKPDAKMMNVNFTCSGCGQTGKYIFNAPSKKNGTSIGIRGHRCPRCQKFGTMECEYTHDGKTYYKKPHNQRGEVFTDAKGIIIKNPFRDDIYWGNRK